MFLNQVTWGIFAVCNCQNINASLNTDLLFARPKIRGWEAQNEGLMKIQSRTQSMPVRRLGAGHDSGETE
jgi:hypothetical protein